MLVGRKNEASGWGGANRALALKWVMTNRSAPDPRLARLFAERELGRLERGEGRLNAGLGALAAPMLKALSMGEELLIARVPRDGPITGVCQSGAQWELGIERGELLEQLERWRPGWRLKERLLSDASHDAWSSWVMAYAAEGAVGVHIKVQGREIEALGGKSERVAELSFSLTVELKESLLISAWEKEELDGKLRLAQGEGLESKQARL